jgi:hypothetical protein
MTNRFGFNLGDYNTEEIKDNDGFKDIVPEKMRNAKRWLLWRSEKDKNNSNRFRKVPYYADGTFRRGTLDTPDDLERLVTYDIAVEMLGEKDFTGLGFALGKDGEGYWQGIDLDNIKEHNNDSLAERLPGYVEMSPSGNGVHAIGYGEYFRGKNRSGESGWEYYSRAKYFTFTGNTFGNGKIVDLKSFIKQNIDKDLADDEIERKSLVGQLILSDEQVADIERALSYINPDCPRDTWLQIGFSLARVPDGFRLFSEWSKKSLGTLHSVATDADIEDQWNDIHANSRGEITLGTLYHHAAKNPTYTSTELGEQTVKELSANKKKDQFLDKFKPVPLSYDYLPEPDWVIDGFIGEGITFIAGAEGKGKSSLLLPLALQVAGLTEPTGLTVKHRRRVLYITEDHAQADRICYGMRNHYSKLGRDDWEYWIKVIPAFRMNDDEIKFTAEYAKDFIVNIDGREIPPLTVFDTASATFILENENDNSEAARLMSVINNEFFYRNYMPVWISGHTSKTLSRTSAVEELSARGASAWGGNATGTAFIFEDENIEGRILATKKKRFSESIQEVRAVLNHHSAESKNRYGDINESSPYYSVELVISSKKEREVINADNKIEESARRIIKFINSQIKDLGRCTYGEISDSKVAGDKSNIPSIFSAMIERGMVETIKPAPEQCEEFGIHRNARLVRTIGNWIFND